ncbi:MAG TPA: response regulator transcription factor [Anaerolineae bacterium]|nr:response regulator transcription factor [Anaerolineae bacterium]
METILLIEDEVELARVVARELEAAGYTVLRTTDGRSALDAFARARPDLVILDWMLPGLDGLEVLRRIRHESGVPVLMLTARGEEVDRVLGLEVGADDYVTKPFSMRELIARVRALLRRLTHVQQVLADDRAPQVDAIHYEGLTLDPAGYRAVLEGQPLDLTRTEFDLLHFLLRHPGRVFSRAYLLDAVWGAHYVTGDRSVDNAVLRLRRKLGALGDCIETVWGVGYRLRAGCGDEPGAVP